MNQRGVSSKGSGVSTKGVAPSSGGSSSGTPIPLPTVGLYYLDHFVQTSANAGGASFMATAISGAGTSVSITSRPDRYGIVTLSTGTAATGRATVQSAATGLPGPGFTTVMRCAVGRLSVPILSTAVEKFMVIAGFTDNPSGAANDGAYFTLDSDTATDYQCVTSVGGVRTTVASGLSPNAGEEHDLEVTLTASSAIFTIDGVQVANINTNLPTSATPFGVMISAVKSVGTTARTADADFIELEIAV